MYIYLFPFGFQYTFITLPQLGHFSDTIIQPEPVSPMSQARFLHHLSGHFIFRIIPPPLPQNTFVAISPHWYGTREPACPCRFPFILCALFVFHTAPRFPNLSENRRDLPCLVGLWLIRDMVPQALSLIQTHQQYYLFGWCTFQPFSENFFS